MFEKVLVHVSNKKKQSRRFMIRQYLYFFRLSMEDMQVDVTGYNQKIIQKPEKLNIKDRLSF